MSNWTIMLRALECGQTVRSCSTGVEFRWTQADLQTDPVVANCGGVVEASVTRD